MRTDRLCGVQRFKSKSRTGGEASECRVAENSTTEVFCKFQCQCSPVMYEQTSRHRYRYPSAWMWVAGAEAQMHRRVDPWPWWLRAKISEAYRGSEGVTWGEPCTGPAGCCLLLGSGVLSVVCAKVLVVLAVLQ